MPPIDRARLWPVDEFELQRQQRVEFFWLDLALLVMWFLIVLCLVGVVLRA